MTATARRILTVRIKREVDDSPDLSHLGEYTNRPGGDEVTIDREARGDKSRHEYRYFVAALSGAETGNPESVEQDYKRMEDYNRQGWCMVGVWAEADVQFSGDVVQTIRSGGLWGIESDSGAKYFTEVERDELGELSAQLKAAGFKPGTIRRAMKDVKRDD
jgi:hypothetical protein